jgi:hypothetical protein
LAFKLLKKAVGESANPKELFYLFCSLGLVSLMMGGGDGEAGAVVGGLQWRKPFTSTRLGRPT